MNMDPDAKGEVSESLIEKMKAFLGDTGTEDFTNYYKSYGTVSPVFMDGKIPHPVHFREGMQIRNFMRTLPECEDWSAYQLDNTWRYVVARAIGVEEK